MKQSVSNSEGTPGEISRGINEAILAAVSDEIPENITEEILREIPKGITGRVNGTPGKSLKHFRD